MSKFIGALKGHFMSKLESTCNLNNTKILWVVTVPALWSQKAKKFMREAAEKVGQGRIQSEVDIKKKQYCQPS